MLSLHKLKTTLFEAETNAPLVIFRMLFGVLLAWQAGLLVCEGWVKRNLIDPKFTFSHIGMEWLQPLPGTGMYWYFGLLALYGLLVMAGLFYRFAIIGYTVLWAGVYFMQKTTYNNHYYLLVLLCLIMCFLPANANFSVDSKRNPKIKTTVMPAWCRYVIIAQIAVVYFYAAVAKLYPEWLNGTFTAGILNKAGRHFEIGFFRQHWFHVFIAWAGLLFDLLIVPLLLYRKTRVLAFIAAVVFHVFNGLTLHIGIFPYLSLAMLVFFIPQEKFRIYKPSGESPVVVKKGRGVLLYFFVPYFILQVLLPIRHHFIQGDVLWTEEGHRLSWRMMLRKRSGYVQFKVQDKQTGKKWTYNLNNTLTPVQLHNMKTKPDMLWQMAQRIKNEYAAQGKQVGVYITSKVSVNKKPERLLIDPHVDMALAEWNYFSHNDWILTYEWEK
ncbi:hypothetical protein AM493_20075 [Flavobacterium akiainvivens]|uniref:HTTM-like domain-containing protein n=1 Tax=Flavobacterium akiainvivens TaxID=1202724 RepID=A0A0M8ML78_9FLAO|nr:HTTM domain-containing protein [Flavobacterium akiainvivens]KOS08087.1 hypothetical protein AM493_20075 [Flavobacterium akiainvivens]SFQ71700.1 Vitamin K-dependent gamma-carboxylase [Flavobacterium akiainvivens]